MTDETVEYHVNEYGFVEVSSKPTVDELAAYYREKYYQQESSNYQNVYSKEELQYFQHKDEEKLWVLEHMGGVNKGRLLDIGCGEGFTLANFESRGWSVKGLDFSTYGLEAHNQSMVRHLVQGDIFQSVKCLIEDKEKFDVVIMNNFLEHALDPAAILVDASELLAPKGVLVIQVPNDFSLLQEFLVDEGRVSKRFWIAYPDHPSYFSRDSLKNFCAAFGWKELFCMADFPIDWYLANKHSNYIENAGRGRAAHGARIDIDTLLHKASLQKKIDLYRALADVGFGRQLVGFYSKP